MLACTLDSVVSKLFDTNGFGDIRLEMLSFVRKKTPDIGGENIVLAVHIRRDGEKPAGIRTGIVRGTGAGTGTSAPAETPADVPADRKKEAAPETPVRGKIIEA